MIPFEAEGRNRKLLRAEGRGAFHAGTQIIDCPYTLAAPVDRILGIQLGVEWCNGWKEAERETANSHSDHP